MAATCGWTSGGAGGDANRMRALAQELVSLQPDIIVTNGTAATAAVQWETRTIPIVFVNVPDPVASGIVARLDRPGGNITGFAEMVVNRKTAKALGLAVPPSILLRADEVIE